jgi:hypothetical protein
VSFVMADQWVKSFRGFNHSKAHTTAAAEGFNFSIKVHARRSRRGTSGRDIAWLLNLVFGIIEPQYSLRDLLKETGAVRNIHQEGNIRQAIEKARSIPAGSISVLDADSGRCTVDSSSKPALQYQVQDPCGDEPSCSCPAGVGGAVCKHAVACMLLMGQTETEIFLRHGSLAGTEVCGGDAKLRLGACASVGSTATPEVVASAQRTQRPVDHWPAFKAAMAKIQAQLQGKEGHSSEVRDAAWMLQRVAAIVESGVAARDSAVGNELRRLTMRGDARPGNTLQRQKQLFEVVQTKRRSSSGAKRVAAAPPVAIEPGLVSLRKAPRRQTVRKKSFAEQLGSAAADTCAHAAAQRVQQTSLMGAALEAASQPAEARQPYMRMLIED